MYILLLFLNILTTLIIVARINFYKKTFYTANPPSLITGQNFNVHRAFHLVLCPGSVYRNVGQNISFSIRNHSFSM